MFVVALGNQKPSAESCGKDIKNIVVAVDLVLKSPDDCLGRYEI